MSGPVRRLEIGIDGNDPHALAAFWAAALGYEVGEGDGDPYIDLVPPTTDLPLVYVQRVPEPKTTKTRVHLDLHVADAPAEVARLLALGATTVGDPVLRRDGGLNWQVMADPGGTEFCICSAE